ncbi:AAA family ATPase, partial [Actinoplanes italicus]|uniref:AAA family ATPase n=1 Tax=Actinoplanes italicus TaxID=113567 RepID=UPI001944F8C3
MGLFVGIGVGSYDQDQHPALPRAVPDVTEFAERLSGHFVETVLIDPDEEAVRKRLRRLAGEADGALVLLWAGHGTGDPAHLVLLASDSRAVPNDGFDATQVARACAGSGASQILLILDTCYSGGGLPAATVAAEVLHQLPVDHDHMWVGVLTSCAAVETAQDGLLGERLRMLLDRGPRQPVLRVRWSVHNRFIRGDDLCDALIKEWDSDRQTPQFQGRGSAWWMFPNPLYDPGAPEQVVEHLLWAARSSGRGDERSWFTGRTIEVNQVVEWVRSGEPGVYVVTGSPGTGKSAITGRVVSLSNPHERDRLLTEGRRWEHDDPGERSVRAHLHARGLSVDQAADLIAGQLVAGGLLPAQEARRNAAELVGQVQRVVEAGTAPPVIVVDGVDEARGEAFALADELLTRLARFAVVVVSTRDLPRLGGGAGLVSTLSPGGPGIDLDAADARDRTARDVVEYVSARLAGVDPAMDPMSVAEQVGAGVAADRGRTGRPFLLARLVADQLSASPVDTTDPAWRDRVAISVEQAFDHDMSMISAPPSGSALLMNDHVAGARALLTALTRAYGAGLPEEEWLAIANATRSPETRFDRDDLSWVLDQLGRYVIQDSEYGTAVYRVAHQSLADHLRPPFRSSHQQPFDPGALPIAESLTALYRTKIDAGLAVDGPVYLWRYLWRHASDAGPEGLGLLRGLAEINASLAGYLAAAALAISERHSQWGYWHEAVGPTEGAVSLFRMLAADNPAFLPDLTGALNNLGNCYSNVGRLADAVAPTEEAVTLLRALAADNPAFVHDLAMALNNLGNCYSDVGRRLDAIAPTEEAVTLLRAL